VITTKEIADPPSCRRLDVPFTAYRDEIGRFVAALFRYAEAGTFVSLRAFCDATDGAWQYRSWPTVKIDESGLDRLVDVAWGFACRCAAADVAVCFAPPIATFRRPDKADTANLANGLVITAELDINPTAAREKLEDVLGPATVVMESGGEWVDRETGEVCPKVHLHWRLARPTRSPSEHRLFT
jgi:hypothetical protein